MFVTLLKFIIAVVAVLLFFYFAGLAMQGKLEMKVVLGDYSALSIRIQNFVQSHR